MTTTYLEAREQIGLTAPLPAERELVWQHLQIPQAGITVGYAPHRLLRHIFHHPARVKLIAGGVRTGKSLASAVEVICWAPHSDLIWIAADTYDLARQEFEYAAEGLVSLGWVDPRRVAAPQSRYMSCAMETEWGCRIETRSLRDVETFVARAPDLIVMCEPGQISGLALEKAMERLSTRRGMLWMAGTFEQLSETGQWMEDLWRKWARWPNEWDAKSWSVPTWINTYTYPGGKRDPELLRLRQSYATERDFLLRIAGVPVPARSLVIGSYWNPRVHVQPDLRFRPAYQDIRLPVELAIDPGYGGGSYYVVLAFQRIDDVYFIIDEVAVQSLVHEEVIRHCMERPWWSAVTGGVMDPYAGGSHVYGSISPQDVWWREARVRVRLAPRVEVEEAVSCLSSTLRDPDTGKVRLYVSPVARRFIWEMTHWRRKRNPGTQGYGAPSKHNCDAAKAAAYYLLDQRQRLASLADIAIARPYTFS